MVKLIKRKLPKDYISEGPNKAVTVKPKTVTPAKQQQQQLPSTYENIIEQSKQVQKREASHTEIIPKGSGTNPQGAIIRQQEGDKVIEYDLDATQYLQYQSGLRGGSVTDPKVQAALQSKTNVIGQRKLDLAIQRENLNDLYLPEGTPETVTPGIGSALISAGSKAIAGAGAGALAGATTGAVAGGIGAVPGAIAGATASAVGAFGYSLFSDLKESSSQSVEGATSRFSKAVTYYDAVNTDMANGLVSPTQGRILQAFYISEVYRAKSELKQQTATTWTGSRAKAVAKMDEIDVFLQVNGLE